MRAAALTLAALTLAALVSLGAQDVAIQQVGDSTSPLKPRVEALEKAQDWAGLADLMEVQTPRDRSTFLETWLKALTRAGRNERALEICNAALPQIEAKTGPRLSVVRICRAQALSALGRRDEALAAHLENGRLGYTAGYEAACNEATALGAWGDLVEIGGLLAAKEPGLGKSFQGDGLAKLLRFPEAEALLEEAVKLPGHTAMAWANLACCRVERKAYAEAVAAADQALAREPGLMEALYNRGRARFGLQQYAEGRADLAAALATGKADAALAENLRTHIAMADRYLAHQARTAAKGRTKK